jgi:hypothetical protein
VKKLFLFLLVAAGIGLGVNYYLTGRMPWTEPSAEELAVDQLQEAFIVARAHWKDAGRVAGFGTDPSSLADPAVAEFDKIETSLADLTPKLKSREAWLKAEQLRRDLATFKAEMK